MTINWLNSYGIMWHQLSTATVTSWSTFLKVLVRVMLRFLHSAKPVRTQKNLSKYTIIMVHNHFFVMLEMVQALLKLMMVTVILKQTQKNMATLRRNSKIKTDTLMTVIWNLWKISSMLLTEKRNQKLVIMEMEMMILFLMTFLFVIW